MEITSEQFRGEGGVSLLEANSGGAIFFRVLCIHNRFIGLFSALGALEGELDFLGCQVTKPAGCTVSSLITFRLDGQLSEALVPATDLFRGLGANEEFAIFSISGASCTAQGTIVVTGLQTAELPGGEISKIEHEVVAKKSGSKLKAGGVAVSLSFTAKGKLASGLAWLVDLGV